MPGTEAASRLPLCRAVYRGRLPAAPRQALRAGAQSQFGRRHGYGETDLVSIKLQGMIRFASLVAVALACTFGAQAARAQDSVSDLVARMDRLEGTIRNLTGSVEQLQYRNQQLQQQVQALQAALQGQGTARPASPESPPPPQYSAPSRPPYSSPQYSPPPRQYGPPPAADYPPASAPGPAAAAGPQPDGRHDAFNPSIDPGAPGVPRPLGTSTPATEPPPPYVRPGARQPGAPLDLSSLSAPQAGAPSGLPPPPPVNPSGTGAVQAALPPPVVTPREQFQLGYGYVLHKDYPHAVETFRRFLREHPSDRLTPDAQYWLGEALFQMRQYHDAAEAFLAVSTKYGTAARAPDALLRLGESLAALGQRDAACASLGEALRKYPHASLNVRQNVEREQKRAHC